MERQINEFNLTLNGEIEQIDVKTLSETLLTLNSLLLQINLELATNKNIELTVRTYKPGSFDIYLQLLADATALGAVAGIFNGTSLDAAKAIIDALSSILNLKKHLKGKEPQSVKIVEGDNYEIKNNSGDVLVIQNLHLNIVNENEKVDDDVKKLFKTIDTVPYIKGLSLKDNNEKQVFEAKKEDNDFKILMKPNPVIQPEEEQLHDKTVNDAILTVFSIIFTNTRNWEFFYEGNKIPAKLKDATFLDAVMSRRIRFANGDRLRCKMVIHQRWNEAGQVYENKSYSIMDVREVLPPSTQSSFLFDNSIR